MNELAQAFMNEVAKALIPIVVAFVAAMFGLVLEQVRRYVQARVTGQQMEQIKQLAQTAVAAAEQYLSSRDGATRKIYAEKWLERELSRRGVLLDISQLEAWIEAAVLEAKNKPLAVRGENVLTVQRLPLNTSSQVPPD